MTDCATGLSIALEFYRWLRTLQGRTVRMPRYAPNKLPTAVKKRYFELIRQGLKGAAAARIVGVSTSCGLLWFLDAGGMLVPDPGHISPRFLAQDDRITIADGLRAKLAIKDIAASIGKSFQTVYREIERNSKPDGRSQPWWTHNQALLRPKRPKSNKIRDNNALRKIVYDELGEDWSPQQISRYLAHTFATATAMRVCPETIYRGLFAGLLGRKKGKLRTGRTRHKKQRRGLAHPNRIKNMRLIHQRPVEVNERRTPGHWEGDLIIGGEQGGAIGTLVERNTRYLRLIHLPYGWKTPQLRNALITQTADLPPELRKTLTWDQSRELTLHQDRGVDRLPDLLLRPAFTLAARHQRKHQRPSAAIVPEGR
nr:IS30 family transposase [Nocardia abscessus]